MYELEIQPIGITFMLRHLTEQCCYPEDEMELIDYRKVYTIHAFKQNTEAIYAPKDENQATFPCLVVSLDQQSILQRCVLLSVHH